MGEQRDNVIPIRPVLKAAQSGDRRELLLALRDRLTQALVSGPQGSDEDMAAVRAELQHVEAELAELS